MMKCISIQQPWAWAIFHGKDVENRTWATKYRGDLLIHASRKPDVEGVFWIRKHFPELIPLMHYTPKGAIIGKVTMTGCVIHSSSPWFFGPYGLLFLTRLNLKSRFSLRVL